jgi:hypothetical protein
MRAVNHGDQREIGAGRWISSAPGKVSVTFSVMALVVKGMVQVAGTTYRIVRVKRGHYNVIRVLDDMGVGTFSAGKSFEMTAVGIDADFLREIARVAIQGAKTTWAGRIA